MLGKIASKYTGIDTRVLRLALEPLVHLDDDEEFILFYQGKKDVDAGYPLHEIRWETSKDGKSWRLPVERIASDAACGTKLSATVTNVTRSVNSYYQGCDNILRELQCDGPRNWNKDDMSIPTSKRPSR
jgi:hypothetical protein